jgi:hypothetical protein
MPYITQNARNTYLNLIDNAVKVICSEKDFRRAELLGYFAQEIFSEFTCVQTRLNFKMFQEHDKIAKINEIVKDFSSRLQRDESDLFSRSGELNYIISAVIYGVLGDSLHAGGQAKYGFRVFVKGILESISSDFDKCSSLQSRLDIIGKGIITDIIDEMYRRKTSSYEDEKILSSGDLWPLKSVAFVESPAPYDKIVDTFDEEIIESELNELIDFTSEYETVILDVDS